MLQSISPYVYGTTRLGDDSIQESERILTARTAMNAGVWFHTSNQYGSALEILAKAFDQERAKVPNLIIKLGGANIQEIKETLDTHLKALGIDYLSIGQLCLWGEIAESLASGGSAIQELQSLKDSGLVKSFVMEVFPWSSEIPLKALKGGYIHGLIDAFIFYLNPLQRFASNELWDEISAQNFPVISMRTISGGPVHSLRDIPGFAWVSYLQERAVEVAPIFEKSGITSWTEFCVRYAHSLPFVKSTVGSSSKVSRLQEFLDAAHSIKPLPQEIMDEISILQYRWSKEVDVKAEPWTM